MHQHGYLAFWVDADDLGVLGVVAPVGVVFDHHEIEAQALLQRGDLYFRAEHAERSGVERDGWGLRGHGVTVARLGHRAPPRSFGMGRNVESWDTVCRPRYL